MAIPDWFNINRTHFRQVYSHVSVIHIFWLPYRKSAPPQAAYLLVFLKYQILFLLYMNDMPQVVHHELLLYADETRLIFLGSDMKTIKV